MTPNAIRDVIHAKRELHPELARPLRWDGLRRIVTREDVGLFKSRLPRGVNAQLVQFMGAWSIVLNADTPARRHTYYAAHELGHLWLHHDATCDRRECVYKMDEAWADDPREDEAELFAMIVLGEYAEPSGLCAATH